MGYRVMSHKPGANIGGVMSIDCIHGRCVVDLDTKCWHFRTARGRPMPRDKTQRLWVYGVGVTTVTRATWALHTGQPIPSGMVVSRTCESYDCANPAHLRCWPKSAEGAHLSRIGRYKGNIRRVSANTINSRPQAKLTHELAQWARESGQTIKAAAHGLGVASSVVGYIRRGEAWRTGAPSASIFSMGVRS